MTKSDAVSARERRPCTVNDVPAIWHGWAQVSEIVPPSLLKGGYAGGVVMDVVAIVELEDGTVKTVLADRVRFTDSKRISEQKGRTGKN